jgi:predicted N-acetyltransferase YhbS
VPARGKRAIEFVGKRLASTTTSTVWIGSAHATIRVASGSDGPQALALLKRAAEQSEFLLHCPNELATTDEQYSAVLEKKLAAPNDLYLVVEVDGQIIGSGLLIGSTLRRFAHEAMLSIAVLSEWWGKGVGRAVMRAQRGGAE